MRKTGNATQENDILSELERKHDFALLYLGAVARDKELMPGRQNKADILYKQALSNKVRPCDLLHAQEQEGQLEHHVY